tara:strand:- start:20476 stop:21594 length:1119 start_codon:yes stop_codon:yes gene_type:complete
MSKAAELAALIGSQSSLAIPNMIINGDCRVAQRGTSLASITSGSNFQVDRWNFQPSGHGTWTLSQNSSTGLAGFETSVKALCTSNGGTPAGADFVNFLYNIEGYDTQRLKFGQSDAERFTVSWYVKSNKTGTGIVEAQTTHSSGTVETTKTYTISQANTWEFKSVTFPANTDFEQVAANKTTLSGLGLRWAIDSGTNLTSGTAQTTWANQTQANRWVGHDLGIGRADDDYMEITGVQLDIGDVAQPFKHESYGDNLQRCQRYFYKFISNHDYGPLGANGMQINTNSTSGVMYQGQHPITMRTGPSMAIGGNWTAEVATGAGALFALTGSVRSSDLFWQSQEPIPSSGASDGAAAIVYGSGDDDAFLSGDAEL